MTHTDAERFFYQLKQEIKESRLGVLTQNHIIGMIVCIEQYLPQLFKQLPVKYEK